MQEPVQPPHGPEVLSARDFDAVIFDLDGVVTRTAAVHRAAWKRLFDEYLARRAQQAGELFHPFTEEDYLAYVDGRPRRDGLRAFLASRGLYLPPGQPGDSPEVETEWGMAARKQGYFLESLKQHGVPVDEAAVALLRQLKAASFHLAVVTASRNAAAVLEAAGLSEAFEVRIDGVVAAERNLPGKPAPDTFLEATRRLGVAPARAVVLEDARAGVAAGRRGGFGRVIGVRRAGPPGALKEAGADVETDTLESLKVEGWARPMSEVPLVWAHLGEVARRLSGRRLAFFLDYDGTLTPIVSRPEDAHLTEPMRRELKALSHRYPVAIISGRDLPLLKSLVGLESVSYAGSHGFDMEGPGGVQAQLDEAVSLLPELSAAEAELSAALRGIPGARLERKRFSVAVHWRQVAPARAAEVDARVAQVLSLHPKLRRASGKKVHEVQPAIDWHKGRAVVWLLRALGLEDEGVLPLYLGDDWTDEDAFQVLRGWGLSLVVRGEEERLTQADYALRDTEEVRLLLEWLVVRSTEAWEARP